MFSKLLILPATFIAHADALGLQAAFNDSLIETGVPSGDGMLLTSSSLASSLDWTPVDLGGGTGGTQFDDTQEGLSGIRRIEVRSGDRIDQLKITYAGGQVRTYGSDGGSQQQAFALGDDESLVSIFSEANDDRICRLQFGTDKGRYSMMYGGFGGKYGLCNNVHPGRPDPGPQGWMEIKAFFGRSGEELDHLGYYYGPNCKQVMDNSVGYWEPLSYSSADGQMFEYTYGRTESHTEGYSDSWTESTTASISAGFTFKSIDAGVSVETQNSKTVAKTMESTISMTTTVTETKGPFPAGQLWQWKMIVEDNCGKTSLASQNVVQTPGYSEPPCCPVGMAADPTNQSGACADPAVSLC